MSVWTKRKHNVVQGFHSIAIKSDARGQCHALACHVVHESSRQQNLKFGQMAIEMMSLCSASTLLVRSVGSDTRMETPKRQQYARTMLDGVMMINGLARNV